MSTELIETWVGPIAAVGIAFGTLAHYFRAMRSQDEKREEVRKELLAQLSKLKEELAVVQVKSGIVFQLIEKELPKILLRENTPEIDYYLRKMSTGELTDDEKKDAIDYMQGVIDGNIDIPMNDDKRLGYLLAIIKLTGDLAEKRVRESFRENGDV